MEEKEGFVKNSKFAIKGMLNGILGASIYEIVVSIFITALISSLVTSKNPNASGAELEILIDNAYNAFPYGLLISCIGSLIVLVVFVVIIKFETFKQLCKKAINLKTLQYGIIAALCIMGFSIFYNSLATNIFNLDGSGNANQDAVTELIKSNVVLGLLSVVILAPITEELTYRYCMFGEISKKKKWLGYLISGVVFMLMHSIASYSQTGGFNKAFLIESIYLPPYLFSGLALCYVYDKTNNIGSSVIAHLLNNLVSFLIVVCL